MKKTINYNFLFIILVIVALSFAFIHREPEKPKSLCTLINHTKPLAQEIVYDKKIKEDAFVQYLRVALNNYLSGQYGSTVTPKTTYKCDYTGLKNGKQCPDGTFDEIGDGYEYSLSKTDKSYLQGKFIVLGTDKAVGGGEVITLLFKDKPDKVFFAWVYGYGGEGFDLRGFGEHVIKTDEPSIEETQKTTINQICDVEMGI